MRKPKHLCDALVFDEEGRPLFTCNAEATTKANMGWYCERHAKHTIQKEEEKYRAALIRSYCADISTDELERAYKAKPTSPKIEDTQ